MVQLYASWTALQSAALTSMLVLCFAVVTWIRGGCALELNDTGENTRAASIALWKFFLVRRMVAFVV